jgi:hypothetical protein
MSTRAAALVAAGGAAAGAVVTSAVAPLNGGAVVAWLARATMRGSGGRGGPRQTGEDGEQQSEAAAMEMHLDPPPGAAPTATDPSVARPALEELRGFATPSHDGCAFIGTVPIWTNRWV